MHRHSNDLAQLKGGRSRQGCNGTMPQLACELKCGCNFRLWPSWCSHPVVSKGEVQTRSSAVVICRKMQQQHTHLVLGMSAKGEEGGARNGGGQMCEGLLQSQRHAPHRPACTCCTPHIAGMQTACSWLGRCTLALALTSYAATLAFGKMC